jgi:hypothetical protein
MSTLNQALDESLTLLETGQGSIEECLARYPEHSGALRPLLETAWELSRVPKAMASDVAFTKGKQRMLKALAEKKYRRTTVPSSLHRWTKRIFPLLTGEESMVQRRTPVLRWALATTTFLALFIIGGLALQTWSGTRVPQTATLYQLHGLTEIRSEGSDVWQRAQAGTRVKAGDQIRTGPLARATLTFFDGSVTILEADTEVVIVQIDVRRNNSDRMIMLRQRLGWTRSHVKPSSGQISHFVIKTPAAVTTARGTEFALDVETDGDTHIMVAKGAVDVTVKGSTTSVSAGEMTSILAAPSPLSNSSHFRLDQDTTRQESRTDGDSRADERAEAKQEI